MIKKLVTAALILLLTLSMTACAESAGGTPAGGETETDAETAASVQTQGGAASAVQTQSGTAATDTGAGYEIKEAAASRSDGSYNYEIKYPQITGLGDTDKRDKINGILKDEAVKVLKYYEGPDSIVDLNAEYRISLMTSDILSVLYTGLGSVRGAAHPNNLFYTTNIDMKTGERIRLSDAVTIGADFAGEFRGGAFTALLPVQDDARLDYTDDRILTVFTEADSLDSIGTEKQSDVFSYFTKDSLGISIPVGHAIGDHAEFEIKYSDLRDDIRTGNAIWESLPGA